MGMERAFHFPLAANQSSDLHELLRGLVCGADLLTSAHETFLANL